MISNKYKTRRLSEEKLNAFFYGSELPYGNEGILLASEILATREELAEMREQNKFIPVTERLPEKESTEVWETYICEINRYGVMHTAPLWFVGGSWYNGYYQGTNYDEFVVSWRPLPPAPEVE